MADGQVNLTDEELALISDDLHKDPSLLNRVDSDTRRRWARVAGGATIGSGESAPKQYTGSIESPEDWKRAANFFAGGIAGQEALKFVAPAASALYQAGRRIVGSPVVQDQIIEAIPGAKNVRAAVRTGRAAVEAVRGTPPAPAVESPVAPVSAPAPEAPIPIGSAPLSKVWGAMDRLGVRLRATELPRAVDLVKTGTNAEAAIKQVLAERAGASGADAAGTLAQSLGTPSDAEVMADMGKRAVKGQKTLMKTYGP